MTMKDNMWRHWKIVYRMYRMAAVILLHKWSRNMTKQRAKRNERTEMEMKKKKKSEINGNHFND